MVFTHSIRGIHSGEVEEYVFTVSKATKKALEEKETNILQMWETFEPDSQQLTINMDGSSNSAVAFELNISDEKYFATTEKTDQIISNVAYCLLYVFGEFVKLEGDAEEKCKICICRHFNKVILYVPHFLMPFAKKNKLRNMLVELMDNSNVITILANHGLFISIANKLVIGGTDEGLTNYYYYAELSEKHAECKLIQLVKHYQDADLYRMLDTTLGVNTKTKALGSNAARSKIKTKLVMDSMNKTTQTEKEIIASLCSFVSSKRTMDYNGFIELGQCLFNVTRAGKYGLEHWKTIAIDSPHVESCQPMWENNDFNITDDGMRALRVYACQDDKEGYMKWKTSNTSELMLESLGITGGKSDIAKVVYNIHNDEYVCSDYKGDQWYYFSKRWIPMDGTLEIKKAISSLITKYEEILKGFNNNLASCSNDVERGMWSAKVDKCVVMIKNLKDTKFRESIAKECAELFYDESFERTRDTNTTLFGFDDMLYDTKIMGFRDSLPKDKVTMTCGYKAPISYYLDHPDVQEVVNIINKIITNPRVRHYFLKLKAYAAFEPGNSNKLFVCMIGPSNGGKTVFEVFSEMALGEYWVKPPLEQLTYEGTNNPDGATASKEILRYAREVQYSEASKGSTINTAFIKTVSSGGDSMYSRNLHQIIKRTNNNKFTPTFVPIYTSNFYPKFDGNDSSMTNRISAIECNSIFIDITDEDNKDKVPLTEKEQLEKKTFPMDDTIKGKIKNTLYPAYMWLLTHYYCLYKNEGINKPKEVKFFTKLIAVKNDIVQEFIGCKLDVDTTAHQSVIKQDDLYKAYKVFYSDRYPSSGFKDVCMPKDSFDDVMIKKGFNKNQTNDVWEGIAWRRQ